MFDTSIENEYKNFEKTSTTKNLLIHILIEEIQLLPFGAIDMKSLAYLNCRILDGRNKHQTEINAQLSEC